MARIGVALSGGGHRAALFGLGALLYLVDAGKNREVSSIASVSGGSLTTGVVAQSCNFAKTTPDEFSAVARRLASQIVSKGTLWAAPLTWIYLATLLLGAAAAFVEVWFLPVALWLRIIVFVAALFGLGLLPSAFLRARYARAGG